MPCFADENDADNCDALYGFPRAESTVTEPVARSVGSPTVTPSVAPAVATARPATAVAGQPRFTG